MTVLAVALGITPGCLATRLRPKQSNRRLKHTFTPPPCQALPIGRLRDQIDARFRRWQFAHAPIQIKTRRWRQCLLRLLGGLVFSLTRLVAGFTLLDDGGGGFSPLLGQFDPRLRRLRLSQGGYAQILRGRLNGGERRAQDDLHLAQRGGGIIGNGSRVDADFAGNGIALPVRAAFETVCRCTGVLATYGSVRLFVSTHFAVTLRQLGDFQLLLALLPRAGFGFVSTCCSAITISLFASGGW